VFTSRKYSHREHLNIDCPIADNDRAPSILELDADVFLPDNTASANTSISIANLDYSDIEARTDRFGCQKTIRITRESHFEQLSPLLSRR